MQIGYKLAAEAFGPAELIRQAVAAEKAGCAGFDHLVMQNAGPDPDGFIDFYQQELDPVLRKLTPQRAAA